MLVKMVRKTLFRTIVMGSEINLKYKRIKLGFFSQGAARGSGGKGTIIIKRRHPE